MYARSASCELSSSDIRLYWRTKLPQRASERAPATARCSQNLQCLQVGQSNERVAREPVHRVANEIQRDQIGAGRTEHFRLERLDPVVCQVPVVIGVVAVLVRAVRVCFVLLALRLWLASRAELCSSGKRTSGGRSAMNTHKCRNELSGRSVSLDGIWLSSLSLSRLCDVLRRPATSGRRADGADEHDDNDSDMGAGERLVPVGCD